VHVPAPEPGVEPPNIAPTSAPAPTLVDVKLGTEPAGSTVTLVDAASAVELGTTPLSTSLDATRTYDVVFTRGDVSTRVHLDPSSTRELSVSFAEPASPPAPPPARSRRVRVAARVAPAHGSGTLMISTKPPCEILIDDLPTWLTTPQREIPLSAGRHRVTLINEEDHIHKTVVVTILSNRATKVVRDLLQ
jgi:hypothetical protein